MRSILKRTLAVILVSVMVLCALSPIFFSSAAKETKKRTIAIVYDNSGSMYMNKNQAWCQAQYAMEVFATMMNEGDRLMVYPMWPVTPEGSSEVYTYQNNPMVITDDDQKSLIHTLKSDLTNGDYTPIESIDAAHDGLVDADGEKWLVVLTDGKTFYDNLNELDADATKRALEDRFKSYISGENILYLGIGENLAKPEVASTKTHSYAARTTTSKNVPVVLTEMCNIIFGRDVLPDNHKTNKSVNFDIPLSKLYVFIQGEGIGNVKLSYGGTELKPSKTFTPTYGTGGCDSPYDIVTNFGVDDTLKGYIAEYNDLAKGEYSYSYSGSMSSVEFYYEVDADLQIGLVNENGNLVSEAGEVAPGNYKIRYALVDKDGNVLTSDLLKKVSYDVNYSVNGEVISAKGEKPGEIEVSLDESTELAVNYAEVNFLNGYKIRKDGTSLGFLSIPFKATKREAKELTMAITGGSESVDGDCVADAETYLVSLTYDGKELTGDALDAVQFNAAVGCESMCCEVTPCDEGYKIKLKMADGFTVVPEGEYEITANALITSKKYKDSAAETSTVIKINKLTDKLKVEFVDPTTVYSTVGIKKAPEMIAKVTYNGEPLTAEQFDALDFSVSADGVDLITKAIPGESSYSVRIDPDGKLEKGEHVIGCTVTGVTDRYGEVLTSGTELGIKLQMFPQWMIMLFWLLGILLLILLIVAYMRMPVLPKKIRITNVTVKIGGTTMNALKANAVYTARGRKGSIKIVPTGNLRNAYWSASLVAPKDSYRYLPSRKRKALVVNGTVTASGNVDNLSFGSETFIRDDKKKLVPTVPKKKDFKFPKAKMTYSGKKDINGNMSSYSVTGDIKFE